METADSSDTRAAPHVQTLYVLDNAKLEWENVPAVSLDTRLRSARGTLHLENVRRGLGHDDNAPFTRVIDICARHLTDLDPTRDVYDTIVVVAVDYNEMRARALTRKIGERVRGVVDLTKDASNELRVSCVVTANGKEHGVLRRVLVAWNEQRLRGIGRSMMIVTHKPLLAQWVLRDQLGLGLINAGIELFLENVLEMLGRTLPVMCVHVIGYKTFIYKFEQLACRGDVKAVKLINSSEPSLSE